MGKLDAVVHLKRTKLI